MKSEKSILCLFCSKTNLCDGSSCIPRAERAAPPSSFPWNYTQHQDGIALNCVHERLLYLELFRTLLARCVLRPQKCLRGYFLGLGTLKKFSYKLMVIASSLRIISAYEKFHRDILLSNRGGKPVLRS